MTPTRRCLLRLAPLCTLAIGGSAAFVLIEHRLSAPDAPIVLGLTQTLPRFALPGMTSDDLRQTGSPLLLNIFASWCGPCVLETPSLMKLRLRGVAIWGIAYKDKPDATTKFLAQHGNPYARVAHDEVGSAAEGLGLTGVPETFLIDKDGDIRWRWSGGLSENVVTDFLDPILRGLG